MTDIEKGRLNIGILTAASILISAVGLGFVISNKINEVNISVQSVRTELHEAIDSVKNRQMQRSYETDLKFQKLDEKLDRIEKK